MRRHEVAIIVPCYNEKKTILKVYKRIKKYGKILIVDDHSIDGTRKILIKKKIKFLKNKKNIGYEASIINGMKHVLRNWKKVCFRNLQYFDFYCFLKNVFFPAFYSRMIFITPLSEIFIMLEGLMVLCTSGKSIT